MDLALLELNWEACITYLNDVIVFAKKWEEHLYQVLQQIRQTRLKLNPDKCHLDRLEVAYLGHIVFLEEVQPNPHLLSDQVSATLHHCETRPQFLGPSGVLPPIHEGVFHHCGPPPTLAASERSSLGIDHCMSRSL